MAARAAGEEGRDVADAIGYVYSSRMCRWCVALVHWWEADFTGAIAQFRELVAESEAAHDEMWRVASLVSLGHLLAYVRRHGRGPHRGNRGRGWLRGLR